MKKILYLLAAVTMLTYVCPAQVKVQNLLCEDRINPLGLDASPPRFSWQLISDKRNVMQASYEIRVSSEVSNIAKGNVWNSGKVMSPQSVFVPFGGSALQSSKKYFWQVRVWDNSGKASPWSDPGSWQMGILKSSDWKAKWIGAGLTEDALQQSSPLFRKKFVTSKKILQATAFVTSHGLYEAAINGKRIGDAYLTPGWTSYNKRLQYQQFLSQL